MIDLHSHILPGLDDGAADWQESLAMCRMAVKDGITDLVATPHILPGLYNNNLRTISQKTFELREKLKKEQLILRVYVGGDVRITPEIFSNIDLGELPLLGLGGNGCRYLLLEFPSQMVPPAGKQVVFQLLSRGIVPIITHPERNHAMQYYPRILGDFIQAGALAQITAMSLTGGFGPLVRERALYFLKKGWVKVIATDAHSVDMRPPVLSSAVKVAQEIIGKDEAVKLVKDNPANILKGEKLEN